MGNKIIHWSQVRHHWPIYLFVLPTLVLIGLFQYYPAASGVFHSFYNWNGAEISEWVGGRNYADLFRSTDFWNSFQVALILGACNVVKMVPALLVAVCIHRCRSARWQLFYRTMFVVPMVIPGLVVVLIWRSFFFEAGNGYLNRFLYTTHLFDGLAWMDTHLGWGGVFRHGSAPAWLGDPRLILTAVIVWGFPWVGSFAILTHLAKLQGIPRELYEAAEVDGVSWWSKFTKIELPLIAGSIYLLLVFLVIDTIKDAGTILLLAGMEGGPGGKVSVPALFMLRKAFIDQKMGYACAVGIVLTLVVLGLQKAATTLFEWRTLSAGKQWAWRTAALALGMSLWWAGRFQGLAVALVLAGLPWRSLASWWQRGGVAGSIPASAVRAASTRVEQPFAPWQPPAPRIVHPAVKRTGELLLRAAKHAVIWAVLLIALLPLYLMLVVSLKTNPQFYEKPAGLTFPIHWENWRSAWQAITPTLANSLFVTMTATVLMLFLALGAAYFFTRLRMPLSRLFWNAVLILMMIPTVANLVPLFSLLDRLNLLNTLTALILVGASAGQVFAIFVLRNFMADLPTDLFEAAEIDGASHLRQLVNIVLPLSGPVLGTVAVMRFLSEWNEFVLPLIVIRDRSQLPVMVQLQRLAGEYVKYWGPLMAGYAIASVPIIILFVFSMKLFVRGLTEGASKG